MRRRSAEWQVLPDEIETARLKLRPIKLQDVDPIFESQSDPEWARYELLPAPFTRKDAERFVASMVLRDRKTNPVWVVTLGGEVIGTASMASVKNWKIAALGYGIHRRAWGQGFARETVGAVLDRSFAAYRQLRKVRAHTDPRNERSIRLLRRLGFTLEGTLRANQLNGRNEFVDEAVFGLLREEWPPKPSG